MARRQVRSAIDQPAMHPLALADRTSIDWLIITGNSARLTGAGEVLGVGIVSFEVWMVDGNGRKSGEGDFFRIRIRSNTGQLIYDNGLGAAASSLPTTPVHGGNTRIHH